MKPQANTFRALSIPNEQIDNLTAMGYAIMTPIQAQALPLALKRQDLIAQAKTGSGKTAAFGIPLIENLEAKNFAVQGLILCPTRELSTQVASELRQLARYKSNIKIVVLGGGQAIGPQIASLEHGAHVVVGTPGRIQDHLRKKTLVLDQVSTFILDEADRMLDMGFTESIEDVMSYLPSQRHSMLFSATFPHNISQLSRKILIDPVKVEVESVLDTSVIEQKFYKVPATDKIQASQKIIQALCPQSLVIFCNTKQAVNELTQALQQAAVSAQSLHGDMEQKDRDKVLVHFKQKSLCVLVATDVAARGLDIDNLDMVLNFDLPRDPEVYIHRIGRTGRAGKNGLALSLVTHSEQFAFETIVRYYNNARETAVGLPKTPELKSIHSLPANHNKPLTPENTSLCIAGGRRQKIRAGDILGALTKGGGLEAAAIGKIDILHNVSYVAVRRDTAKTAFKELVQGKIKGKKVKVFMD